MFFKQLKIKYGSDDYVNISVAILKKIVGLNKLYENFNDNMFKKKLEKFTTIYDELTQCKTEDIILNITRYETSLIYSCLCDELLTLVEKSIFDDITEFDKYKIDSYKKTLIKFNLKNMKLMKGGDEVG